MLIQPPALGSSSAEPRSGSSRHRWPRKTNPWPRLAAPMGGQEPHKPPGFMVYPHLPQHLAWRQRDATRSIPLNHRCHILARTRFCHLPPTAAWQPPGAGIPPRVGPGHRRPSLLVEQNTCSSPAPSPRVVPVRPWKGFAPHRPQIAGRAYPAYPHPGRRSLPAPPAAHPSPQAVLPVLSHTHTLSLVPARRADMLTVSSVRCQGTLCSLRPQPRCSPPHAGVAAHVGSE
ncbi:uncharacterized protein [Pithys albifrons albifrons]|uniref:uncharacterized protein n=1 Tax=Pithys albifrons albifrons TaxID=3385563 RepID=UPI003A5D1613